MMKANLLWAIFLLVVLTSTVQSDKLQEELDLISRIAKRLEEAENGKESFSKKDLPFNLKEEAPFICTGGKDLSKEPIKDYLKEFNKGPCSPTAIIAGITATKLVGEVNCNQLRLKARKVFDVCGWTSCRANSGISPKKRYSIWVPSPVSGFGIIYGLLGLELPCYSHFMKLVVSINKGEIEVQEDIGVKVKPLGQTEPKILSDCGFKAINNLFPWVPETFQSKGKGFSEISKKMVDMGYVSGVTMQPLVYDWRQFIAQNGLATKQMQVLEEMKKITGKRVTIISHSLGSLVTWRNLLNAEQSKKDKVVSRWIAIAPAFLGSQESTQNLLGLTEEIKKLTNSWIPVNPQTIYTLLQSFFSLFQLLPKDTKKRFKDEDWMKALLERIEAEDEDNIFFKSEHPVISLFPSINEICTDGTPDFQMHKHCSIGIGQMENYVKVGDKQYNPDSFGDLLEQHSFVKNAKELFNFGRDERLESLENPGVEITIIYSNHLQTPDTFSYSESPKSYSSNFKVHAPNNVVFRRGDGVLLTSSTILPGIKWADDYEKRIPGSKPIIFVEGCSLYNQKDSIFSDPKISKKSEKDGSFSINKSGYMGVKCNCQHGAVLSDRCESMNHARMHTELNVVSFITKSLVNYEKSEGMHWDYQKYSYDEWDRFEEHCLLFTEDRDGPKKKH